MEFNLTSMQKSFYTKGTGFGNTIWNHSVFAILDKKYSRDRLNEAYNSLVSVNDCLRARIEETSDGPKVIIDEFQRKEYPYYEFASDEEMDRWALMRLTELMEQVRESYESYTFHDALHKMHNFCVVDMSNFYFDIIKDRIYCGSTALRCSLPRQGKRRCAACGMMRFLLSSWKT